MALALLVGIFAGCGGADTSGKNNTTATISTVADTTTAVDSTTVPAKKDVTISFTATGDKTWIYPVDEAIIADFTKETGIKIDIQRTPSDQYAGVLKTKFASGEGPDMSMIWPEANAAQFFPEKNFLDLSNETWVAGLTESAKRNQTFGGKVIGWGTQGGDFGWGMMYNKEIFSSLNLTIPKTFDEFTATCEKIKAKGIIPFYGTMKDQWSVGVWMALMGPLAERNNPGLYDKLNNNTANYADVQEFETFINQFKTLYDKGLLGNNPLSGTCNDSFASFCDGKTAMVLINCTPDGWLESLKLKYDANKYAMFPAPFLDNNTLASYDGGLIRVINKNGKKIDACKEYFNYISKPEILNRYYADPERTSASPAFKANFDKFEWKDSTKSLLANSDGKTFTIQEVGIKYWDNTNFGKYIEEVIVGDKTAKQALQAMDKDRKKILDTESK